MLFVYCKGDGNWVVCQRRDATQDVLADVQAGHSRDSPLRVSRMVFGTSMNKTARIGFWFKMSSDSASNGRTFVKENFLEPAASERLTAASATLSQCLLAAGAILIRFRLAKIQKQTAYKLAQG